MGVGAVPPKFGVSSRLEELGVAETEEFRGIAATLNYMSLDGPDLQFPIQEVIRQMARPRKGSWKAVKKVARYLLNRKGVEWNYAWQEEVGTSYVASDSGWGGNLRMRKST